MFDLNLNQFTDSRARCRKVPHDKIPLHIAVLFELSFEKIVVGIANYIFKKVLLLDLHCFQMKFFLAQIGKVFVHRLDAQIDRFWLEKLHQITFIGE